MKKALLLTSIGILLCVAFLQAQNVFDPADALRTYNSGAALGTSTNPNPNIAGLQKWVSTPTNGVSTGGGSWNTTHYKQYYIYVNGVGMAFRLKFPKSYTNPDSSTKKYPVMLFWHGAGEPGCPTNGGVYNNEKQLTHGGRFFNDKTEAGNFDGYLLYPQAVVTSGCWSNWGMEPWNPYYGLALRVIDSLVKYARLDIDRLFVDGLSNGGMATWFMASYYPGRVATIAPAAAGNPVSNLTDFVHIPIWFGTGGNDTNPGPDFARSSRDQLLAIGADVQLTIYPGLGHGMWNQFWAEPNFFPYMNAMHKANPLIFFGRSEFCPDSAVNVKLGISQGFYAYEWQKDGVTIATRTNGVNTIVNGSSIISYTGNDITINSYGTYRVHFKRTATSEWSAWSPKPAVIKAKATTQTPTIMVTGTKSKVLPAPDGSTTVGLQLPEGYTRYNWYRNDTLLTLPITTNTIVATPGTYKATVVEQFGCGSLPSMNIVVASSDGSPKPDPAKNLTATPSSLNGVQLDWSENPNAGQNEAGFEVYRSETAGGPYTLITITNPDVIGYLDQPLQSNKQYYYIVRAVSTFGAAENSNEAAVRTSIDNVPPAPPGNFRVLATATNYAYLAWDAATDNVGVTKYELYINGVKTYTSTTTSLTVSNLDSNQVYTFFVKAKDAAGNESAPSSQVTASTAFTQNGLSYKYAEGTYTNAPNFGTSTILKSGFITSAFDMTFARSDNWGALYEGYIKIPVSATYTFELCSDDGARLFVGKPYSFGTGNGQELINNDGVHSSTCKTATIYLAAGLHPIAIPYFGATGSNTLSLRWRNGGTIPSLTTVPNSAYFRAYEITSGTAPVAPTNLVATGIAFNKIQLTWTDNSNNESGFEITRSLTGNGTYLPVTTVTGTSYIDSNLNGNTRYFYKIRAVGPTGESAFTGSFVEATWLLNSSGAEATGNTSRDLTLTGATTIYNTSDKKEGTAALAFSGTNSYATINGSAAGGFPSDGGYTERTVALWIKPSSTINKRVIFDFGSNVNGLGLRFNSGALQAGVASSSVRNSISVSSVSSNPNWISGGWNHVAVVYNQNSLKLFVNAVEVASNNALAFKNIPTAVSNSSRFGNSGTSNNDNVFNEAANVTSDNYNGLMDGIRVIAGALSAAQLSTLKDFNFAPSMDTTLVAPTIPAAPTTLAAQLLAGNKVKLTWNDNANNETGYEIWRSSGNNTNYRLAVTAAAGAGGQQTFTDTTLFANVTYYYKVRARGISGTSAYTNEVSVATANTVPVLDEITDFTIKGGGAKTIAINATDTDGDPLTFTFDNLPYFATLEPGSNGNGNIHFNTTIWDLGAYTITMYVDDGFNGRDTVTFSVAVNDNELPVINPITSVSLNEGATPITIPMVANDPEGNGNITWWAEGLPSFATLTDSGNGRASIKINPSFSASGSYIVTVNVDDGMGAVSSQVFGITIGDVDPNEKIQSRFAFWVAGAPLWNDIDVRGTTVSASNLRNIKDEATTVGMSVISGTFTWGNAGMNTGNNSGVYPDGVMSTSLNWGTDNPAGDTVKLRVTGLSTSRKYNFVFFASSVCPWCGLNANSATTYKIGNEVASVKFFNNSTITDTIYQIQPGPTGEVIITMIGDPAPNVGGLLNALVIDAAFNDGTTPVKPLSLTVAIEENEGVRLTWVDKAYNENSYKVFRATNRSGPYALRGNANADATTFLDNAVLPFTQYYYYVLGNNSAGDGASSDTVGVKTINNQPAITGLIDLFMKTEANVQRDFAVADDAGDVLTVTIADKPAFVSLQSLGGNNYRLIAAPTINDIGFTSMTISVKDDKGAVATKVVNIGVTNKDTRSVYLTFGLWDKVVPAPWNFLPGYGSAGLTINSLKDESNVPTTFGLQLVNGWADVDRKGHPTGNNSGVFPDAVLGSGIIDNQASARTIRIFGLDNSKRYNLTIVSSHNEGVDASGRYVAGAISDTLNARYNTNQSANLNGLTPSGGEITVNISRLPGADYITLQGIQIEEYATGLPAMAPLNLYVEPKDRNGAFISWSDRTNNEDAAGGFQLQRATNAAFTASVTDINLPANTTTYTNTGLSSNTKYWYRVRAKVGGVFTAYSNVGQTITPQSIVNLHFNASTPNAGFPWNSTAALPSEAGDYTNLFNQSGQPSGVTVSLVVPFNGDNLAGVNTGNNSGVVPDLVLQSAWWQDREQLVVMKVKGLNRAKRYRIGFIASMGNQGWYFGDYTGTYTIGGRTVYLNAWMNSTKIVYIGDVVPDENGEVKIDYNTTPIANWAFNCGIIVQAYDDPEGGSVENSLPGNSVDNETVVIAPIVENAGNTIDDKATDNNVQLTKIKAYPNPFNDFVNLDFNNSSASNDVMVEVYDLGGRVIMRKNYGKLAAGFNTLRLNTGDGRFGMGVYVITLKVNGKPVNTAKMIKSAQ